MSAVIYSRNTAEMRGNKKGVEGETGRRTDEQGETGSKDLSTSELQSIIHSNVKEVCFIFYIFAPDTNLFLHQISHNRTRARKLNLRKLRRSLSAKHKRR